MGSLYHKGFSWSFSHPTWTLITYSFHEGKLEACQGEGLTQLELQSLTWKLRGMAPSWDVLTSREVKTDLSN